MINQLKSEILSELMKIENIAEIKDYVPEKFSGFPSIFFNFDRVNSSNLDSNKNERVYYFNINILQEITNLGNKTAEENIAEILDNVIDLFDKSDLNGLAIKIEAVGGNIERVSTEAGPAVHAIIILAVHTTFITSI